MDDWLGEAYAPHRMVEEAIGFIEANRERPFFLYLPFIEPHVAMHPPRATVEKFPESWDREPYRGEGGYLPHPRPRAGYAAMIAELDDHVGRVMEKLREAGVADRTLVLFSSDNGPTMPKGKGSKFNTGGVDTAFFNSAGGLRGFKGDVYEGGIRVPMIARLPGRIPPGAVNDFPSYFADWFKTLCEAAELETPPRLDGESLWRHMTGQSTGQRKSPLVWAFSEYGGQVAVRMQNVKVLRRDVNSKQPAAWEAYDLSIDPREQHNLAATRRDLIEQAKEVLRREVVSNETFSISIPDVNDGGANDPG
jgi:arylsulfatase A-like enzyme